MTERADMLTLYGGIETGGTKSACIIGTGPDDIVAEEHFPTTMPAETIGRAIAFFEGHAQAHPVSAIGIASFGPLDLDRRSPTYGFITTTPKPGWAHTDLCGPVEEALQVPVTIDTDVNAAALAEYRWLADDEAADPLLYVTVGTGIGLGAIVHGEPLHGLLHPEAGHMLLPHDRALDPFEGACPYHGDCWEGLASGLSIERRWGRRGETLPPDHPAWQLEAQYLGLGIANLIYCLSPRQVVGGGGVMQQPGLIQSVRRQTQNSIHGYLHSDVLTQGIDRLIVLPRLGSRSGVLGGMTLAARLLGGAGL